MVNVIEVAAPCFRCGSTYLQAIEVQASLLGLTKTSNTFLVKPPLCLNCGQLQHDKFKAAASGLRPGLSRLADAKQLLASYLPNKSPKKRALLESFLHVLGDIEQLLRGEEPKS